jgi:outer membrane lipoprotein SlyB
MKMLGIVVVAALFLSGCAGVASYRPIVDLKGVERVKYQADLEDCKDYGERVNPYEKGFIGATLGAVGGLFGNVVLGKSIISQGNIVIGSGAGAVYGAGKGMLSQKGVVDTCLVGRGYKVLKSGSDFF